MKHLRLLAVAAMAATLGPWTPRAEAGYNYYHYTAAELAAESSQADVISFRGNYRLIEPVTGASLERIEDGREHRMVTVTGAQGKDWFFLDRKFGGRFEAPNPSMGFYLDFRDGYVRIMQQPDNTAVTYDVETGDFTLYGDNQAFTLQIDDEGYCALVTRIADSKGRHRKFAYDPADGFIKLMDADCKSNLKLFYRDPFMFELADPYAPMTDDGTVTVSHSIFPTDTSDCQYIFNDGETPSEDDFKAAGVVKNVELNNDFDYSDYGARKTFTLSNKDRKPHLWIKPVEHYHGFIYGDGLVFHARLDGKWVTNEADGHFRTPDSRQEAGAVIDFERQRGVKVYYTTDGSDPRLPGATTSRATGETFDVDRTPLVFDGNRTAVRFVAYKPGLAPSDVTEVEISTDGSTLLDDIESDASMATKEYYNLQGIRITAPTRPGIYIIRTGDKVEKRAIR